MACCKSNSPLENTTIAGLHEPVSKSNQRLYKIVVCGQPSVGKTCLVDRLLGFEFEEFTTPTIGVEFKTIFRRHGPMEFKIQIWDTAGQDRFRAITNTFFRKTHAVIFVYDLTQQETFKQLHEYWVAKVLEMRGPTDYPLLHVLLGNKSDLPGRVVAQKDIRALSRLDDWLEWETSAKKQTREHLVTIFDDIITWIIKHDSTVDPAVLLLPDSLNEKQPSSDSTDNEELQYLPDPAQEKVIE